SSLLTQSRCSNSIVARIAPPAALGLDSFSGLDLDGDRLVAQSLEFLAAATDAPLHTLDPVVGKDVLYSLGHCSSFLCIRFLDRYDQLRGSWNLSLSSDVDTPFQLSYLVLYSLDQI